jgi:hypothetical protein
MIESVTTSTSAGRDERLDARLRLGSRQLVNSPILGVPSRQSPLRDRQAGSHPVFETATLTPPIALWLNEIHQGVARASPVP